MILGRESGGRAAGTKRTRPVRHSGFSLIELLIGMTIMALGLLSIASMFATGYTSVTHGGRTTMATAAARQMLEDIQDLAARPTYPFANLLTLDGRGTENLPAANPERDLVRKWRYALGGDSTGAEFTAAEKAMWSTLSVSDGVSAVPLGATGRIAAAFEPGSTSLVRITVTVSAPRRPDLIIATLISRL